MSDHDALAERAAELVEFLPRNVVRGIVTQLRSKVRVCSVGHLVSTVKGALSPERRDLVPPLVAACTTEVGGADAHALALALDSASAAVQRCRDEQSVEVVWSGPTRPHSNLRRTEQVLLEMISKAEREIWLVSFVAYRVDSLKAALVAAIGRGVQVNLLLETVESSEGGIDFDGVSALAAGEGGPPVVYEWPLEHRPRSRRSGVPALHAKACLADGRVLFSSSANMTGRAFDANLELGVLIQGGSQPRAVRDQLRWMVESGEIRRVSA